ncbi:hypothetical protein EV182_000279 [Spiromyces aspiralis]|uniref:Uncharacterized protein n=1 Tax=Spiromyces aspiralis TaxID=68401 RepID=A0ACC1HUP9_9FUNG|nr:hypothetical protein EV182_000279 [Spiromyces aspiralis]
MFPSHNLTAATPIPEHFKTTMLKFVQTFIDPRSSVVLKLHDLDIKEPVEYFEADKAKWNTLEKVKRQGVWLVYESPSLACFAYDLYAEKPNEATDR